MSSNKVDKSQSFEIPEISHEEAARIGSEILLRSKICKKIPERVTRPSLSQIPTLPQIPSLPQIPTHQEILEINRISKIELVWIVIAMTIPIIATMISCFLSR